MSRDPEKPTIVLLLRISAGDLSSLSGRKRPKPPPRCLIPVFSAQQNSPGRESQGSSFLSSAKCGALISRGGEIARPAWLVPSRNSHSSLLCRYLSIGSRQLTTNLSFTQRPRYAEWISLLQAD